MGTSLYPTAPRTSPYTRQQAALTEDQSIDQQGNYGNTAQQAYLTGAQNFDASKALNTYAQGAWGSISSALGQQLKQLQGSAVGAGRLDTGYYDIDNGTLIRGALNDFSNNVAQQSINATGLQLRNQEDLANFGNQAEDRSLGLLTARRQEMENDYREAEAKKRSRRRGIGGAIGGILGGVAGGFFGQPMLGAELGGALGSSVGG